MRRGKKERLKSNQRGRLQRLVELKSDQVRAKLLQGLAVIKNSLTFTPFPKLLCLEAIVTGQNLMAENSVVQMNYWALELSL